MSFYFALQYSAIQKAVLRHDRLWSMAGISQILLKLNEIDLPSLAKDKHGGDILVAGGGKFTASFSTKSQAEDARQAIVKTIATTLPMLEFQHSDIIEAESLKEARQKNLVIGLAEQKRRFRGYGLTYNPHFMVCEECGEYPATKVRFRKKEKDHLCRFCFESKGILPSLETIQSIRISEMTSIEKIYLKYLELLGVSAEIRATLRIPDDFEKLFPHRQNAGDTEVGSERRRMAVWLSDTNNMNTKVPIWLSQNDKEVPLIFHALIEAYVDIAAAALKTVFPQEYWNTHPEEGEFLPFRLIVAGGDDLCIIMSEEFVLDFAMALSKSYNDKIESFQEGDYLSMAWLEKHRQKDRSVSPGPFSFGGAFVITPIHTPFKLIHELGEDLMGKAKKTTDRQANSLDWRILSVEEKSVADEILAFEKPVFIHPSVSIPDAMSDTLSLQDYLELRNIYRDILSSSQIKNIASALIKAKKDPFHLESLLVKVAYAGMEKGVKYLLADSEFRRNKLPDGELNSGKIATLLELLTIPNRRQLS